MESLVPEPLLPMPAKAWMAQPSALAAVRSPPEQDSSPLEESAGLEPELPQGPARPSRIQPGLVAASALRPSAEPVAHDQSWSHARP